MPAEAQAYPPLGGYEWDFGAKSWETDSSKATSASRLRTTTHNNTNKTRESIKENWEL